MRDDGGAEFELEMSLKDPTSKIYLFKVRRSLYILLLSHFLKSDKSLNITTPYYCLHLWCVMFEQDGVMIPFDADTEIKHGLKQVGKKFVFSINGVDPEDAGLYQVEVDGVKVFSTDFKRKMMLP